ncbi:MAG: hypothetical protein AB7P24_02805 [Nitrospira sp.]
MKQRDNGKNYTSTPTRVKKMMMRYQHCTTTEIYVEQVQQPLEGAEDAVTQM